MGRILRCEGRASSRGGRDFATIDFRQIENAETIWTTNQWDEASRQFIFFARSSPEEIAAAIRGTDADPSIFFEAGWTPVAEPPPPAFQLMRDSIDVSLGKNAEHAFAEGVSEFLAAYVTQKYLGEAGTRGVGVRSRSDRSAEP